MVTPPRGKGSYIDSLMKSCDTSPCDLSPERILEKYGKPVKSPITESQSYNASQPKQWVKKNVKLAFTVRIGIQ